MAGVGVVRYWIATLVYPFYFARPENDIGSLQRYLPDWIAPHSAIVAQRTSTWAPGPSRGSVARPDARLDGLLRRLLGRHAVPGDAGSQALDGRRAPRLPHRRARPRDDRPHHGPRDAAPLLPEPGDVDRVQRHLPLQRRQHPPRLAPGPRPASPGISTSGPGASLPWSAVFPIAIYFTPLLIGFGFLVSTEISFSIWFFFLLYKLEALVIAPLVTPRPMCPTPRNRALAPSVAGSGLAVGARATFKQALVELFTRARAPPDPATRPSACAGRSWG